MPLLSHVCIEGEKETVVWITPEKNQPTSRGTTAFVVQLIGALAAAAFIAVVMMGSAMGAAEKFLYAGGAFAAVMAVFFLLSIPLLRHKRQQHELSLHKGKLYVSDKGVRIGSHAPPEQHALFPYESFTPLFEAKRDFEHAEHQDWVIWLDYRRLVAKLDGQVATEVAQALNDVRRKRFGAARQREAQGMVAFEAQATAKPPSAP